MKLADRIAALRPTAVNRVMQEVKQLQAEGRVVGDRDLVTGSGELEGHVHPRPAALAVPLNRKALRILVDVLG